MAKAAQPFPRARRHRKSLSVTLSATERALIEQLDRDHGFPGLSRIVAAAAQVLADQPFDRADDAIRISMEEDRTNRATMTKVTKRR